MSTDDDLAALAAVLATLRHPDEPATGPLPAPCQADPLPAERRPMATVLASSHYRYGDAPTLPPAMTPTRGLIVPRSGMGRVVLREPLPPLPSGMARIVPRGTGETQCEFPADRYAPLPVLFPPVQDTSDANGQNASDSAAFDVPESRMGHCHSAPLSTTLDDDARREWLASVRGVRDAELKARFPGEHVTHGRMMGDANRGECVVAGRWHSFRQFLEDMGQKPEPSFTLDRINPHDPEYAPGKCRWLDKSGQARNRTNNLRLRAKWRGEVLNLTVAEWAERTGQKADNLYKRNRRRKPSTRDHEVIGQGAQPASDDIPAASPHPPPPGWHRCPRAFTLWAEAQGLTHPPKSWVMYHLAFRQAFPPGMRALATVPVFLAWRAYEQVAVAEDTLWRHWNLPEWGGSGYVPRAMLGNPLLTHWQVGRAILTDAEAMLTEAEQEFLGRLRYPVPFLTGRSGEPIRDRLAPVRAMMVKRPPTRSGNAAASPAIQA